MSDLAADLKKLFGWHLRQAKAEAAMAAEARKIAAELSEKYPQPVK